MSYDAKWSVTSSKMAAKMAAILNFTKTLNLSRKTRKLQMLFARVVIENVIQCNIVLLLAAFYKFLHHKKS